MTTISKSIKDYGPISISFLLNECEEVLQFKTDFLLENMFAAFKDTITEPEKEYIRNYVSASVISVYNTMRNTPNIDGFFKDDKAYFGFEVCTPIMEFSLHIDVVRFRY